MPKYLIERTVPGAGVYLAANEDIIREHARCGGFTVDAVYEVRAIIDPASAELVARPTAKAV